MHAYKEQYKAFLLRLWQVEQNGNPVWRASLEDTRTGEKRGFRSLEALVDFLKEQLQVAEDEQSS